MDPASTTEQSDVFKGQVKESAPWDLEHQRLTLDCYTKEDWVTKKDEEVILHRLKHLTQSGGLESGSSTYIYMKQTIYLFTKKFTFTIIYLPTVLPRGT